MQPPPHPQTATAVHLVSPNSPTMQTPVGARGFEPPTSWSQTKSLQPITTVPMAPLTR